MENETDIIRSAGKGERKAQEILFRKYVGSSVSIAYMITKDWGLAEDAVQEAFIRAFRYIYKFDCSRPFKPWFTKIVVNQSKKTLRKKFTWLDLNDYRESEQVKSGSDEENRSLMEELGKLHNKYRIPIILKYFGGFSEEEIGTILRLPKSTIKSRLYMGRTYIKKGFMMDAEVEYEKL